MGYADFQCSVDDPPGYRNAWTAESVVDLPDPAIDRIVARAADLPAGPPGCSSSPGAAPCGGSGQSTPRSRAARPASSSTR